MAWQTYRSWVYGVFFADQIEYGEESFLYQKLSELGRMLGGELSAVSINEDGSNRFKFVDSLPPVPNISGCEYLCLIRDDVGWPGGPSEICSVLGCHMDTKSWDLEEKLHPGKREKVDQELDSVLESVFGKSATGDREIFEITEHY